MPDQVLTLDHIATDKLKSKLKGLETLVRELLDASALRERVQKELAKKYQAKIDGGTPLTHEEKEVMGQFTTEIGYIIGDGWNVLECVELRNLVLDEAARIQAVMDTGVSLFRDEA
jgi:hypothetical protein